MRSVIATALLLFVTPIAWNAQIMGQSKPPQEWRYVTTDTHENTWKTYLDVKSIRRMPKGIVQLWLKQIPIYSDDEERKKVISGVIQNREYNQMPIRGYEQFAYSLTLIQFNCKKRLARSISIKDYDEAGSLLGSQTLANRSFARVFESSMAGMILGMVCK
jgi:surface-adhesin protein E